jgi:hypothetical protein
MFPTHYAFNDFETNTFEALDDGDRTPPTRREIFDKRHSFKSELKT